MKAQDTKEFLLCLFFLETKHFLARTQGHNNLDRPQINHDCQLILESKLGRVGDRPSVNKFQPLRYDSNLYLPLYYTHRKSFNTHCLIIEAFACN